MYEGRVGPHQRARQRPCLGTSGGWIHRAGTAVPKQRRCCCIVFLDLDLGAFGLPFFWRGAPNIGGRFGDEICVGLSTTPTQGGAEPRTPNPDANGGLGAKPPDCRHCRQLCRLAAKTTCRHGPFRGRGWTKSHTKRFRVRVRVRKKGFGFGFFPNPFLHTWNPFTDSVLHLRNCFPQM